MDNFGDSLVFVPGWGFQADNPGRDLQSCRDYVGHAMPPAIGKKDELPDYSSKHNLGIKSTFDSFMWNINTLHVADHVERQNRKLGLIIKEDRAKAERAKSMFKAERDGFEKFKLEHAAEIAKVDQMAAEIESLRAKLADQEKKTESMEAYLQQSGQELNAANAQRDEAIAARDRATAEREQAIFERDVATEVKKKLQVSLPDLVITSIGCPGIKNPFAHMVKCARAQGQHEVAYMAAQHLNPLPAEIAAKIDPEAVAKGRAAGQALASLTTSPFLEKLVEDLDMPVEVILSLKP